MTTPRHPGSRVIDHPPNLLRAIHRIEARIAKLTGVTRTEHVPFIPSDPTKWEACTAAAMTNVHQALVYRSGSKLFADVACGTVTASVVRVQFSVPDLSVTSAAATTAAGGTQQTVRISLDLPDAWVSGDAHTVYVQGMRVSGTEATTMRVQRAWQR